jgi:hypothetical protein
MRAAAVMRLVTTESLERLRFYPEAKENHGLLKAQGTVSIVHQL